MLNTIFITVAFLSVTSFTYTNPGILISIPFPISPPLIDLSLPLPIDNILINHLELTQVQIRLIEYKWTFALAAATVNISSAKISYNWQYKEDSGYGYFSEEDLRLLFNYNFISNSGSRFKIDITSTQIHPGKMKVSFGGPVKETVAVQVTNLILNHASITFRSIIANKLSNTITGFSSILGVDRQIYNDKANKKQIFLNTSLVTPPILSNQALIIQMNAAPYIGGESSGYLNPPETLVRKNSTKIAVQIHKALATKLLTLIMHIRGEIAVSINTLSITSVIDINSQALSPLFPPMAWFKEVRDVVLDVKLQTLTFDFVEDNFEIKSKGHVIISTQSLQDHKKILFLDPVNASISAIIQPIYGFFGNSLRVSSLSINSFAPSEMDIAQKNILPQALSKYFPLLMSWLTDGINFELNKKVVKLSYNNIGARVFGKSLNSNIYQIEIQLYQKKKVLE